MDENLFSPTEDEVSLIEALVDQYVKNKRTFEVLADNLKSLIIGAPELGGLVHSTKWRVKDADHLRDKLQRKLYKCKKDNKPFDIDEGNLFVRVNDLAGFRILHLHTRQMQGIDNALRKLFESENWILPDPPFAHTWDIESRDYFASIGIRSEENPRLYTSVHYIVQPNKKSTITAEVQVRTLAEEIWGEVDHSINYPQKSSIVGCVEQIHALARVASGCTRLVDSIFATHEDAMKHS